MNTGIRIVKLACVGCGANLEITNQMDRFACAHCGASQVVERSGGAIHLRGVTEAISRVQVGTDKTAAELAIARLTKEYETVQHQRAAKQAQLMGQRVQAHQRWQIDINYARSTVTVISLVSGILGSVPSTLIAMLLYRLVSMASPDLAGFLSAVSVLIGMVGTGYLMRNLMHRSDTYNPDKLKRNCDSELLLVDKRISNELGAYDQKLKQLQTKINENYRIANS